MKIIDLATINPKGKIDNNFINYIDTSSVIDGTLQNVQYLTENFPSRAQRCLLNDDILISSVRPNLKHNYFVKCNKPNLVGSTGFIQVRVNSNKVLPKYLYYFLTCENKICEYSAIADSSQTTFPSFNKDVVENMEIVLPELCLQQHIVDTI